MLKYYNHPFSLICKLGPKIPFLCFLFGDLLSDIKGHTRPLFHPHFCMFQFPLSFLLTRESLVVFSSSQKQSNFFPVYALFNSWQQDGILARSLTPCWLPSPTGNAGAAQHCPEGWKAFSQIRPRYLSKASGNFIIRHFPVKKTTVDIKRKIYLVKRETLLLLLSTMACIFTQFLSILW